MDNTTAVAVLAILGGIGAAREVFMRRRLADAARQLAEARAQASARQDLASVGEAVSGLAQELKTPVQGVLGGSELMMATSSGSSSATEELQQIHDNAARAAGIVRSLLRVTETTALARRWHDVHALVERAVALRRGPAGAAAVRMDLPPTERLPLVYVDGRQLEKAIAALLARPGGSTVPASVAIRLDGGRDEAVVIEIEDRSPRAPDDETSWSADVAASRRVLEAHGGSLTVEARPGDGFFFHMELPTTST